ncbi:PepSY-associated TM helix domain-containing protein [Rhodococcus sp. NPDC058521]|uniref:PepSY-associated TM helix domain-containing protein n=1 Tax=Rhodococcus sp. NPDC058521 TaxID=3346536 RepID=UPI00364F7E15
MSVPELERDKIESRSTPPKSRYSLRPLVMRMHFYAGILVAPFLVLATISGGLYAVAPTIEQIVYRDYLHVDSTGPAMPVPEQIEAAQRVRPDLTVAAVRPAAEAGDTTKVLFTDPALGESERLAVFVDPVTTQSRGELVMYGSGGALPIRTWISQLHRHLHLGEPGRIYSELAASWLWVIALGGIYLWIERYRATRRRNRESARMWTLDRKATGRPRTLSWHGVAGIWIAAGLVFLSATGLTWSKYAGENVTNLRSALSWTTPAVDTALSPTGAASSGGHDSHAGADDHPVDHATHRSAVENIDSVLEVARTHDVSGEVEVAIPADTDTAFEVEQTRQPWQFTPDSIAIDGSDGTVTDISRFTDLPLAAKLASWGIALHMGILFGLASQAALVVLAVALLSVIVRGYVLRWQRRPKRRPRAMGKPPARGAWRRVGPATLISAAAITVGVGWFVPLLGVSLLAFVLVDIALAAVPRLRQGTATNGR